MIDLIAVQRACNMLAKRAGLRVEYVAEQTFCTEPGGRLIVQRPDVSWSESQLRVWRNAVCHEIGHWLPEVRDIFPLLVSKKIDTSNVFGACLNIVDDVRNDRNRCETYPGTRQDKIYTTEYLITRNWIPMIVQGDGNTELANRIINTMICASVGVLSVDDAPLAKTFASVRNVLDDEQQAWLDTMHGDDWLARWYALDSAKAEWQYCVDILRDVFKLPESDIEQMANGASNTGDSGDDGDEQGEGKGKGRGQAKEGASGDGEPSKAMRSDYIVTVKYDEMLGQREHDDQKALAGIHIDYDGFTESQYDPHTADTTRIGMTEDLIKSSPDFYETPNITLRIGEVESTGLANRARRFLQAETRKNFNCNLRQGKLDTRKLTRLVTHDRNSSMVPAIFKQSAQKHAIDTCVSVLVDASGSMSGGGKYPLAVAAAWGMIEVCDTLRIPCEVAAFTEQDQFSNLHLLFKEFSKKVTKEDYIERAGKAAVVMSSNADSDNILIAYNRILQRSEQKKLIIVMSDGSPASYRGECMSYTQKVVKTIEQAHHVDIMGVGILDANVKLIYSNNQVINRAAEIPESLIEILKNNVTLNK